jgi:phosphoribosyl 1,2-cyclic phosphate phosphodiesterase
MKLIFLGTAASEGYPNAFCGCANCEQARSLGGPSLRKRSSVLINDELLIDLGPDLMAAAQLHGVSLANIRYCLQTHEHEDHLDPAHLVSRSQYCRVYGTPHLHFYASAGACRKIARALGRRVGEQGLFDPQVSTQLNLTAHAVEPFQHFAVGPYAVTSLLAAHAPDLTALLYLIEQDQRTLLYATDTGEIPEATWQALRERRPRINLVVMDHTFGLADRVTGHMNWQQFVEQIARLHREDLLADDARIFAHHLAHHSNPPHPALVEFAAQHGYDVAYDGLIVSV